MRSVNLGMSACPSVATEIDRRFRSIVTASSVGSVTMASATDCTRQTVSLGSALLFEIADNFIGGSEKPKQLLAICRPMQVGHVGRYRDSVSSRALPA